MANAMDREELANISTSKRAEESQLWTCTRSHLDKCLLRYDGSFNMSTLATGKMALSGPRQPPQSVNFAVARARSRPTVMTAIK